MIFRTYVIFFVAFITLFSALSLKAGVVRILFTANINGTLENCGCGEEPLGGLGRIKTFADSYRKEHRDVLLIDGGDFFNSYPFPALNQAMLSGLEQCAYDVIVPGDQAFIEGKDFYQTISKTMNGKILLSDGGEKVTPLRKIKKGDVTVVLSGILSPDAFEFIQKPSWLNLQNPGKINSKSKKEGELRITIFHGPRAAAESYLATHQQIDLLLLAHDQHQGVWKVNGVVMVASGKDAEYVSVIEANYQNGWKIKAEQLAMSDDYPESLEILDIIEAFKKQTESR